MPTADDYTTDELVSVCISRQIVDGEVVAQGIATPLVVAGYLLAKCTHAPNLMIASAIGQGIARDWAPLGVARIEELWLDKAMMQMGFVRVAADVLPTMNIKEFFRPGQMDAAGNFNNVALGKNLQQPRLRLPGVGGIPDVTVYSDEVYLYVPRHSRVTFVAELDWRSGLGHSPSRRYGAGPRYLVTDLGQFDFAGGCLRLTSLHPEVALKRVQAKTGFPLEVSQDIQETNPPTREEVRLLREEIDPLGVRRLEMLGGSARRTALREILSREGVL